MITIADLSGENPITVPIEAWCDTGRIAGFVLRLSVGYLADTNYEIFRRRLRARGRRNLDYHALLEEQDDGDQNIYKFDPARQARVFTSLMHPDWTGPAVVDVEARGTTEPFLRAFCDEYDRTEIGKVRPLWIYTSVGMWHTLIVGNYGRYAGYGLWLAAWGRMLPHTSTPPDQVLVYPDPWTQADMLQYAGDNGEMPPYPGAVDLSVYRGPIEQLFGQALPVVAHSRPKLCPHHLLGGPETGRWLALTPAAAKAVGDLGALQAAKPGTLTVGRMVDDGQLGGQSFDMNRQSGSQTPEQAADEYINFLSPYIRTNPWIAVWEGPNEQVFESDDAREATDPAFKVQMDARRESVMRWYADFCYAFAQRLHELGKRAGIGSWSTGNPRLEHNLLRFYGKALQATVNFNAVECRHDYGGVAGLRVQYDNAQFEALGYVGVPQFISECGMDSVSWLPGSGAWRNYYNGDFDRYWNECLKPVLDVISLLGYCIGAAVYADGGSSRGYDIAGTDIVARVAAYTPPIGETIMPITKAQQQQYLADLDAANARITTTRSAIAALTPDDVAGKHLPGVLNQDVVNLFDRAAGVAYIDWLKRAGLTSLYDPAADRKQPYSGPAIEDLPGLTDTEKAALIAALPAAAG